MNRILLIDTNYGVWEAGTICRQSQFEPLGLEYLAAQIQQSGYYVKVIQQKTLTEDELLQEILKFNPDIVGFSIVTCTYDTAKRITKKIKEFIPKVITVFGGYHATAIPEICKEESIDFVVIGEGENTFCELVRVINTGGKPSTIKGIAFYNDYNRTLITTPPQERIKWIDNLFFPLREEEILNECKIESLSWPPQSKQKYVAQVLFSRGCPFHCTFCCSPHLWGDRVRFRTPDNVVSEIKQLIERFGTNYIFFADLTFNLNNKKVLELCSEFIRNKLEINWYAMCRPENISNKLISLMEKAGCTKIAYGIDAMNNTTLQKIKPKQKITMKIITQSLSVTQNSSIIARAFIIIGYPWETKQDLMNAKKFVKTLPIDDLRIGALTPLPGSEMYEEFKREGRLLHEDFSKYTTEECVIKLKDMTPMELYEIREQMFKEFYQSKEYEKRMKEKIRKYPHLKQSYDEFFELLERKGIFKNK